MRCGLLGEKLGHSYSPQIHALLGSYSYQLFEKQPQLLEDFLRSEQYSGLNVTIPYKKAVIPYCSQLSDEARTLGAVNTITKGPDGSLTGHNTDYFGFQFMLQKSGLEVKNKKVLVLGSGGAAVTVFSVLEAAGAYPVMISRKGENNYSNLHMHSDAAVIVNATPVGMYPNTGISPIAIDQFPSLEGALDLIYNPARTQLLLDAESKGLTATNGLWMLIAQAKKAAELFTGKVFSNAVIETIYNKLCYKMQNTVLIGMPGCGKSTIGKMLADKLGKKFVDVDACIELCAGKTIPEIFSDDGETQFRALETKVLADLGKQSGLIIATGGGCVTQKVNYPLLRQNGHIVWIQRDLESLATDGRPLSKKDSLTEMYKQRKPLYASFADHTIANKASLDDAVVSIVELEDPT